LKRIDEFVVMGPMKKRLNGHTFDLKIGRSRTGLGLYTLAPIDKGACIVEYTGRRITQKEEYTSRSKYLFEVTRKKTIDGQSRSNTARYINHSCSPNCAVKYRKGRVFIFARRRIKADEELSYDYGKDYFDEWIKRKGCRCLKCEPFVVELVLD